MKLMKTADFFLSDNHAVSLFIMERQDNVPEHYHEFDEIVVVKNGHAIHRINETSNYIQKGDFFFVNAQDVHYYEELSELSIINIMIRKDKEFNYLKNIDSIINHSFRQSEGHDGILSSSLLLEIVNLSKSIVDMNSESYDQNYFFLMESYFLRIMNVLASRTSTPTEINESIEDKYYNVIRFLKENYMQTINWQSLSRTNGISRRTLFRYVIAKTGKTPDKYLQSLRLFRAKDLIVNSSLSLAHIAKACGFKTQNMLSQNFRREFKTSPSEFRKNFINK